MPEFMQRAFAAGEVTTALQARADLKQYQTGLRTCRNFVVHRHGGVSNRPGSFFMNAVKTSTETTRLFKWAFSLNESFLIEAGNLYFRFYRAGTRITVSGVAAWDIGTPYVIGDLVSDLGVHYYCILANTAQQPPNATYWYPLEGTIYEIPTPYLSSELNLLRFDQRGLIATLTQQEHNPMELTKTSDTHWVLSPIVTGPSIAAPTGVTATPGAAGTLNPIYQVASVADVTYEESLPSMTALCANALAPTPETPNLIAWTDAVGAIEYYVYKDAMQNGTYGFLGVATGQSTYKDDGHEPDMSLTPMLARTLFDVPTQNSPHTCCTYQQRRVFANTHAEVAKIWASRVGLPYNFCITSPLQDDDAVTFTIEGQFQGGIQHLIPLKKLIALTDGGEWIIRGDGGVLTPFSIFPDQEGYAGAAAVVPVVIAGNIVFVQYLSTIIRDLVFDSSSEHFITRDLTTYSNHLFDRGRTIFRLDYAKIPHSIVWAIRSDGTLLGLTYLPEYDVYGWHRHDTLNGVYEDECCIFEGEETTTYTIVRRTVGALQLRYIERFASREIDLEEYALDSHFVDAGILYNGAATTTIPGLAHLEGEDVSVLADGVVAGTFTVSGGAIELDTAASIVHAGLPIEADFETLALDVGNATARGAMKAITKVKVLIENSSRGFLIGPDEDNLVPERPAVWEPTEDQVTTLTEIVVTSGFDTEGHFLIRHTDPTPLTISGVVPSFTVGG